LALSTHISQRLSVTFNRLRSSDYAFLTCDRANQTDVTEINSLNELYDTIQRLVKVSSVWSSSL